MAEGNIQEFISITGADEERARFYLQSANGELHVALETFYDNDGVATFEPPPVPVNEDRDLEDPSDDFEHTHLGSSSSSDLSQNNKQQEKRGKQPGRFATIASFQQGNEDLDNEEGQAFYAGGSEASGQQILGPDKKKKSNEVTSIFDAARTHGAEVVSESSFASENKERNKKSIFKGAGFKLGSDVEPSEQVTPSIPASNFTSENRIITIKFWKNGFSVDDGPLRDLHDPQNKDFVGAIRRGEVPAELRSLVTNGEVHVNLEDHSEEEYKKPKAVLKAFSGQGRVLGSPAPNIITSQNTESSSPSTSSTAPCLQPTFEVDRNKPVTTIQIRFADGTRLVSKFNHDNTIGDVRRLVSKAKPLNGNNFKLMTTFPNKVLEDDNQTLEEAKLLNAVVVQRMT